MQMKTSEIKALSESIFQAVGVSKKDAKIITDVLTETEARGVFTHGFLRLPRYVNCILSGGIKAKSELKLVFDSPSWAAADGENGLGIVLSYKAMELAIKKAKETGIGVVNVRGSHHFGAAGYYTSMAADQGMVGMAMSNGDVLIAATGSKVKTIGNNPFSYAFPAGRYGKIVYDIAMSHTSDHKVLQLAKEGKPVPAGWIIDKDGNPTTVAGEYEKGGTLLPFGGYKGYGMAMLVETLAAVLSGAAVTQNVHAWNCDPTTGGNVGHFFLAMDIARLGEVDAYRRRVDEMIDEIKGSAKADGVSEIYFPGEIEARRLEKCLQSGEIEIADDTVRALKETAKKVGV